MWNQIVAWNQALETLQIAILANPEVAETLPPGYRRSLGRELAKMSPIERQQMHDFLRKYEGWRGLAAAVKSIALLSLMGILLHLMMPHRGLGGMSDAVRLV